MNVGIVSAPLWDSKSSTFAGLLTTSDYINVIQYYWQNPDALARVDQFRLNSLRGKRSASHAEHKLTQTDIERSLGVKPIETISIHPDRPVYEACRKMLESRARRIPIVDSDDETRRTMVVSVITQYRILKFIAVNVKETQKLRKPLKELNVGTYEDLATASMDTPVMDVIHMLVKKSISSVPILDRAGRWQCWITANLANIHRYRAERLRSRRRHCTYQGRCIRRPEPHSRRRATKALRRMLSPSSHPYTSNKT